MNQDMKSRPGNERPTRERIARGKFTLVPAEPLRSGLIDWAEKEYGH